MSTHQSRFGGRRREQVLAAISAVALTMSACANVGREAPQSSTAGSAGTSASGGAAKVGEQLAVAMQLKATGLNPHTVNTAFVSYALLAYEPLIYKGEGKLQPALAESWTVGEGNLDLTMKIRKGVTFSDGDPVTAQAVKESMDQCKKGPQGARSLATVKEIQTVDDMTVKLVLSQPNPMIDEMMSQSYGCGMIISPKGLAGVDKLTVDAPSAGAGAYIFDPKDSVDGDHYTYVANPNYYDKKKQHYKKVVLRVIANPQSALNALTTGQVDITIGDFTTTKQAKDAGVKIAWTPFVWMGLNLIDRKGELTKAMGDVRVRQAINYAIDREAIAKALLGEYGTATAQPNAEGFDMYSQKSKDAYKYNPEKAKALLAEAGYPNGVDIPTITIKFGAFDVMTDAIRAQLEKVGIRLKVTVVTEEKAYGDGLMNKQYSATQVGYGSQPSFIFAQGMLVPTAKPFNGFSTDDPKVMEYVAKIGSASNAARPAIAQELEDYIVDQAWFAPVAFSPVFIYHSTKVAGVNLSGKNPNLTILDAMPA